MPSITYHRFWCHKCNDFTLFQVDHFKDDVKKCKECDTPVTTYKLSDVPEDKIQEQRQRYKDQEKETANKIFSGYMFGGNNILDELFNESPNVEIVETDAGQKKIDAEKRRKDNEIYEKKRKAREDKAKDYRDNYAHLGRNDLCGCSSGKKYKKCCWDKFQ